MGGKRGHVVSFWMLLGGESRGERGGGGEGVDCFLRVLTLEKCSSFGVKKRNKVEWSGVHPRGVYTNTTKFSNKEKRGEKVSCVSTRGLGSSYKLFIFFFLSFIPPFFF